MERRSFIKNSLAASVPFILPDILYQDLIRSKDKPRSLVLIHLSGGNDWYNTIIPYRNSDYYVKRPTLAIDEKEIIKVDPAYGFHPAMTALSDLYYRDNILVFNGLACDHGDNSHYTAERLWKTASGSDGPTWLERLSENSKIRACTAKSLRKNSPADFKTDLGLAKDHILQSGEDTIVTLKFPGFDTHQFQKYKHHLLLEEYSEGLRSFIEELDMHEKFKDTLVLTWSEFGRSMTENTCKGTEHGNSNALMLMGGKLKQYGIYRASELVNWRAGDIYAAIIKNWFHRDPYKVLNHINQTITWV